MSQLEVRLDCRIPRHFGPPHLHVSGGFEDRDDRGTINVVLIQSRVNEWQGILQLLQKYFRSSRCCA